MPLTSAFYIKKNISLYYVESTFFQKAHSFKKLRFVQKQDI